MRWQARKAQRQCPGRLLQDLVIRARPDQAPLRSPLRVELLAGQCQAQRACGADGARHQPAGAHVRHQPERGHERQVEIGGARSEHHVAGQGQPHTAAGGHPVDRADDGHRQCAHLEHDRAGLLTQQLADVVAQRAAGRIGGAAPELLQVRPDAETTAVGGQQQGANARVFAHAAQSAEQTLKQWLRQRIEPRAFIQGHRGDAVLDIEKHSVVHGEGVLWNWGK
ncbi:hypothetical protein D3C71_1540460 [compost metagenome]